MQYFHVSSSLNRDSILRNGLDWRLMGLAPGIAGSREPEQRGIFLCRDEFETDWFVKMNNTGGPVDVWTVIGVDESDLVESPEGHHFVSAVVPPAQIKLFQTDL